MAYLTSQIINDPRYQDNDMFGVICITYIITIPIGYLIMNKLPERLKENEKLTTFLLFLWLFIIPCIVCALYAYYRDYK